MESHSKQSPLAGLLSAAARNDVASLRWLVEGGYTPVDASGIWGGRRRAALAVAALHGSCEAAAYLLQSGAKVQFRADDVDGMTALHCAAEGGGPRCAKTLALLLQWGAERHALDGTGRRPADYLVPAPETLAERLLGATAGGRAGYAGGYSEAGVASAPVPGPHRASCLGGPASQAPPGSDMDNEAYQSDDFRMFEFKIRRCAKARAHDWTECPFTHPGEKARRRDPRRYVYGGTACPDFRKGACRRGDGCEFAHGVFECWLHPTRYRTQTCKDGTACARRVCFFAHTPPELRAGGPGTGNGLGAERGVEPTDEDLAEMAGMGGAAARGVVVGPGYGPGASHPASPATTPGGSSNGGYGGNGSGPGAAPFVETAEGTPLSALSGGGSARAGGGGAMFGTHPLFGLGPAGPSRMSLDSSSSACSTGGTILLGGLGGRGSLDTFTGRAGAVDGVGDLSGSFAAMDMTAAARHLLQSHGHPPPYAPSPRIASTAGGWHPAGIQPASFVAAGMQAPRGPPAGHFYGPGGSSPQLRPMGAPYAPPPPMPQYQHQAPLNQQQHHVQQHQGPLAGGGYGRQTPPSSRVEPPPPPPHTPPMAAAVMPRPSSFAHLDWIGAIVEQA